jgi:hypothetical protein
MSAMATLKIEFDEETYHALMGDALRHLRPTDWHARALVRQALGLPFPYLVLAEEPTIGAGMEKILS